MARKMDCFVAALLAMTLLATPAFADQKGDCGTIVVPTGIGVGTGADVTSMNPLLVDSSYNAEMANMMYEELIWINRFDQIDWSRSVASAITTPDQGKTYNVTLRPWHWSDGVPVTTADVAYTFKLMKQLGPLLPGYGEGGMPDIIKSLNIISPTQFQVILTHQVNPTWFIYNGLAQLQPLPEHSWSRSTLDQIWQEQSSPAFFNVVDGPVKAQRLDIGRDIILVPNPEFDGPKMHFDRLIFDFLETDGAVLQAVESGEIDAGDAPLSVWNAVQHEPGLYIVKLPVEATFDYAAINFLNPNVAFFHDVRVRDAMADAINQKQIVNLAYHGFGVVIHGPLPPTPSQFLAPNMAEGHYPVSYDPSESLQLLREAGYTRGPDGIMQKNGKRLSFVDLDTVGSASAEQETLLIQADLRKVGIEMQAHEIEFNQMLALLNSGGPGWDFAILATEPAYYPSGEGLLQTGAFANEGHYSDATMDRLIEDSVNKPGLQALFAYENYASWQQPILFLPRDTIPVLVNNRLHGIADFVDPYGWYAPEQLYCTPERTAEN
jgi:peptide/nickel transport system substrate-binding protein